jgi:hypothetical protein
VLDSTRATQLWNWHVSTPCPMIFEEIANS